MKMRRFAAAILSVLMFSACVTGCGSTEETPAATDGTASTESTSDTHEGGADDGKLKVGFAQIGQESGWRDAETASIQFYAGQNLDTIDFKFADAQQKQENQIKAIKSFIDMGVDVIGLAPVVETGWDAVFTEAKDAGIPIILVDRMADVPEDLYATFIGSDFIEEGKNAADEMAKLIGNSGKIVQLEGTVGASSANDRKKGFEDQMAAEYTDIEIIASQTGDFTRAKGKEVMESFLKTYGSEIKGVYAHNDDMMLGAIEAIKEAGQKWLDTYNDGEANQEATKAFVAALEDGVCTVDELCASDNADIKAFGEKLKKAGKTYCECDACKLARAILDQKDYLNKKSVWIMGGDGWAYDIGFGGLDHALASGEDINVLVFDTEVYSNTGGQASKSTPCGSVAQFAATGKATKKKDLAGIAMTYGYVYVAQVAMGADMNQCIKAFSEAESYHGPSIILAYAPCINHGIKGGMGVSQVEEKKAVAAGYWHNFRFDPRRADEGQNPFQLDSKAPTASYRDFIMGEVRYNSLTRSFPDRAEKLFANAEKYAVEKYERLKKMAE